MPLTTYSQARPWAKAIREEVITRRMPKWHAARGYGQFTNDRSLTPFEIALFVAWVDGGAVRGKEKEEGGRKKEEGEKGERRLASAEESRQRLRRVTLPCGDRRLPAGRLLAVRPQLGEGGSAGITIAFPDGRREVIAWIRDFEKKFAETYWLRTPVDVPPGARLGVEASGRCRLALTME